MTTQPLIHLEAFSKAFGGTQALYDVSMELSAGEIHGLVGQNGSGKSTLIKILSGYHTPDSGSLRVDGQPVRMPPIPGELRRRGIGFVHQDMGLVGSLSILENLFVGHYKTTSAGRIRWRAERDRAGEMLDRFQLDLDPRMPVRRLAPTERAIVALIRALQEVEGAGGRGLLVLDEPTARLPPHEVHLLFDAVKRVAESGSAVLFVSHSAEEALALTQRITVLRDGQIVATKQTGSLDKRSLVGLILGRPPEDVYPGIHHAVGGEVMLRLRDVSGRTVQNLSLELRRGEILGITGLMGAGHHEVPYLVYGADAMTAGGMEVAGQRIDSPTPPEAARIGLALLPADRQTHGAIEAATVSENITMPTLKHYRRRWGLDHRSERTAVEAALDRFSIRPREPDLPFRTLSGGNQQKALISKWLALRPRVLLLDEPTQGVDIGSRSAIFSILRDAADHGASILYCSTESEDLAHLCDRVIVFRRGQATDDLSGSQLTPDNILQRCY